MLSHLQGAEREKRADDADDPESHDHLLFTPSLHLEVMMERRTQEDAVLLRELQAVAALAILEHVALNDHGHHLGEEHHADEQQEKLRLEEDGNGSDRAAEREGARVTHEYLCRIGIEPEKPDQCSDHREAVDRELTRMLQIENAEALA